MHDMPVFLVEDIWQAVQGPTSLVELAVEQKEANTDLVEHHYVFCALLHAVLAFSLKSIKPFSLYDTKVHNYVTVLLSIVISQTTDLEAALYVCHSSVIYH